MACRQQKGMELTAWMLSHKPFMTVSTGVADGRPTLGMVFDSSLVPRSEGSS